MMSAVTMGNLFCCSLRAPVTLRFAYIWHLMWKWLKKCRFNQISWKYYQSSAFLERTLIGSHSEIIYKVGGFFWVLIWGRGAGESALANLLFVCPSDFGSAQHFPHQKKKLWVRNYGRNIITFYTQVLVLWRVTYAWHVESWWGDERIW